VDVMADTGARHGLHPMFSAAFLRIARRHRTSARAQTGAQNDAPEIVGGMVARIGVAFATYAQHMRGELGDNGGSAPGSKVGSIDSGPSIRA
jgi:hypothetical protein